MDEKKRYLGREGLLDDTKPIKNEKEIYLKLKNNEEEMNKDNLGFYKKIKQNQQATKIKM